MIETIGSATFAGLLDAHADRGPSRPAIAVEPSDVITYADLRSAAALQGRHEAIALETAEPVALLLPDGPGFVVAMLAALSRRRLVMPVPRASTVAEITHLLHASHCRTVVTTVEYLARLEGVAASLGEVHHTSPLPWQDRSDTDRMVVVTIGFAPSAPPGHDERVRRPGVLLYTSGSTAKPKGVLLSEQAVLMAGLSNAWSQALQPADRHFVTLPLYHSNALFLQWTACFVVGASVAFAGGFDAARYWSIAVRVGATTGNLVAPAVRRLLREGPDRAAGLRFLMYGLNLSASEISEFERRFATPLMMVYGLTETAACGTRTPLYGDVRPDRIGRVSPGWVARVVREDRRPCTTGETGEIWLSGPSLMDGYLDDPAETAKVMVDGGILTGDLGYVDDSGYLNLADRKKSLIKVNGRSVGPLEVADVLSALPEVVECAVVGVPDERTDEAVVAVVVPRGDPAAFDVGTLEAACRERLAFYKAPARYVLTERLPRTGVGKIDREALDELVAARRSDGGTCR